MKVPKIVSTKAINDHTLLVHFDNQQSKKYDVRPWFDNPAFQPLTNPKVFNSVQVEQGGYAVVWDCDVDLSEYELWQHGVQCDRPDVF